LSNCIFSLDDGKDAQLLDGGWLDKPVPVNASKHFFLQSQIVELFNRLVPVRVKFFYRKVDLIWRRTLLFFIHLRGVILFFIHRGGIPNNMLITA